MNKFEPTIFSSTKGVHYSDVEYVRTPIVIGSGPLVTPVCAAIQSSSSIRVIGSQAFHSSPGSESSFIINLDNNASVMKVTPTSATVPSVIIGDWRIATSDNGDLRFSKMDDAGSYITKLIVSADD